MMSNLIAVSSLVLLTICVNEEGPQEPGRESPELAFATYKTAIAKEDWESLWSVLSSGYRDHLIFEAVFSLGMLSDSNDKAKRIINKYVDEKKVDELASTFKPRPTNQQVTDIYLQAIEDKKGMFMESQAFLHARDRNKSGERFGALLGLRVSLDVATAKAKHTTTVVSYHSAGPGLGFPSIKKEKDVTSEIPVYFVTVNGTWVVATENEWRQGKVKKPESTAKQKE